MICGVDLERIVAAPVQVHDVGVDRFSTMAASSGFCRKVLARERTAFCLVVLVIAVDRFIHALLQQALVVIREQRIPKSAPRP